MGVEYNQPAHLLDRYIKGMILTVVDCTYSVFCAILTASMSLSRGLQAAILGGVVIYGQCGGIKYTCMWLVMYAIFVDINCCSYNQSTFQLPTSSLWSRKDIVT